MRLGFRSKKMFFISKFNSIFSSKKITSQIFLLKSLKIIDFEEMEKWSVFWSQ